jgi:hypothetical protein
VIGRMAALPGLCWHDDKSLGPLSRLRALDSALQACARLARLPGRPPAQPHPGDRQVACLSMTA